MLEAELGLGPPPALADQVEPLELEQRALHVARRRPRPPRAAAGRTAAPAPTRPSARRARRAAAGRSARGSPSRRSAGPRPRPRGRTATRRPRARARPSPTSDRTSSSRKNGFPSAGSRIRRSISSGRVPAPTSAWSSSRSASPESASSATSRVRCGSSRAALSFTRQDGWSRSGRVRQDEQQRGRLGVLQQAFEQLERGRVGPVEVLEDDDDRPVLRRDARAARGSRRRSGTGGPRARARPAASRASGSSDSPSIAPRYG